MRRAMIRILLTRTVLFSLFAALILFSMNVWSDQRIQDQKQREMKSTLSIVLEADRYVELDVKSYQDRFPTIYKAYAAYRSTSLIGYVVDVLPLDTDGESHILIGFSSDGKTLLALHMIGSAEFPMESTDFFDQFDQLRVPVSLASDLPEYAVANNDNPPLEGLTDGTYMAILEAADDDGYTDYMQMVVEGGRIMQITWDATQEDGEENRAEASVIGAFVMDNQTIWAEQAYAMENKLIEVQDPAKLAIKSDGRTEIVEGVTMNVNAFLRLASVCIDNSRNGLTADMSNPTITPTITPSTAPSGKPTPTTGSPTVTVTPTTSATPTPTPTPTPTINPTPSATATPLPTGETDDHFTGSEDGVVSEDESILLSNRIDGMPVSEIRTRIDGIPGFTEYSRNIVSSVNQAYLFLKNVVESRAY
jgi:major membrane immunogen (membrane-anchored lipoprotein)